MIDISDIEFIYLKELIELLDGSLSKITKQIEASGYRDVEHLLEEGEYFIGVGFCAMQRFIFEAVQDKNIDASEARKLGPRSVGGIPVAKLVHAAANYWKHSPEWPIWQLELTKHSQRTVDVMLNGRESAYYPLADLLTDLCQGKPLQLIHCASYLDDWRNAVNKQLEQKI